MQFFLLNVGFLSILIACNVLSKPEWHEQVNYMLISIIISLYYDIIILQG